MTFLRHLLCWFGFHRWRREAIRPTGRATLDWSFRPARQFERLEVCEVCGKKQIDGGYVVMGDRIASPRSYNERGWPIDSDGREMPCA
jgi:hypothetical protein